MRYIVILIFYLIVIQDVISQDQQSKIDSTDNLIQKIASKGLRLNFNEQGSSYVKFGVGLQFWYRNGEMNPGTVLRNTGEEISHYSDFALRRMRFSTLINYEDKYYLYTQFGLTSKSNYAPITSGMFFHDLWGKMRLAPKTYIGAGLHMWNGLSRLSNVSYSTTLALDNPTFNFPNVNVDDIFVRQYGVFFQGQLDRMDYQFSINQPLMPLVSISVFNDEEIKEFGNVGVAYNRYHTNFGYKGYVSYSFFNVEKVATTPFKTMSYYGKKGRFLNLGLGFQFTPEASGILLEDRIEVEYHDQLGVSADIWFEQPLPNESSFNFYSAYYHYDYGDNYLRSVAVMGGFAAINPDPDANVAAQGSGIRQFYMGTGDIFYFNAAYVIPRSIYNHSHKIIPFYALSVKSFEGLNETSYQHDMGFHYAILGNKLKLTAQYSTRPIYEINSLTVIDSKSWFIFQTMFKF